ncbi:MAG: DUF885 domain-containing protein [Hyphomonadaceae bacterium]|nr:DUF885 domain-containing protein [Hyphomonadaceae bacterium]
MTAQPMPNVTQLADQYVLEYSRADPLQARLWGLETAPDTLIGDNTIAARNDWLARERAWRSEIDHVEPDALSGAERAIYANLRGKIDSDIALEACHRELWPLSHVSGWQLNLVNSLNTAVEASHGAQSSALARGWASQIVAYIDAEQANLGEGLRAGYSTPRSVAVQVAAQLDALASPDGDLLAAANEMSPDAADAWRSAFADALAPRLTQYAAFIRDEYAPRARTDRSLAALPNGAACYAASIEQHTGMTMSPAEIAALSARLRAYAEAQLSAAGQALWGVADPDEIRARLRARPGDMLTSEQDVAENAAADAERLIAASAPYFPAIPASGTLRVELYPPEQRAGMVASYHPAPDQTGVYSVNPESERVRDRRSLESITSHEIAPGHHFQALFGRHKTDEAHPILTLGLNNAFVEGWAQYAEMFAIEEHMLSYRETAISYWSGYGGAAAIEAAFHSALANEETTARAVLRRRNLPEDDLSLADLALDWMAVMPGQIVSYDLGADFIRRLRDHARAALGERFDYPTFHRLILEEGAVPLSRLDEKIEAWIGAETSVRRP